MGMDEDCVDDLCDDVGLKRADKRTFLAALKARKHASAQEAPKRATRVPTMLAASEEPRAVNWFLASVTEDEYDRAIQVVDLHDGWNATGIRSDYLNSKVLQYGWKEGMRAKLTLSCSELTRKCRSDHDYTVGIIIVGGPACDWERWHMSDIPGLCGGKGCPPGMKENEEHIRSNFPKLKLKACTNAKDMESFIQRRLPLRECL